MNKFIPDGVEFFVTCDLETTGTDVMRCDWITGSFGKIRISDFETLDELELKSRPVNHWDEEARYIHRIPYHRAMEFPTREESLQKLIDWLPPREKFAFVCHANPRPFNQNIKQYVHTHFDFAALKWDFTTQERLFDFYKYFDEKKIVSTRIIATEFFDIGKKLNLKEVCAAMGIEMIGDHHDSRADRIACEEILRRYLIESGSLTKRKRDSKLDSRVLKVQENSGMEEQQRFDV